jgi:hypothetical protein
LTPFQAFMQPISISCQFTCFWLESRYAQHPPTWKLLLLVNPSDSHNINGIMAVSHRSLQRTTCMQGVTLSYTARAGERNTKPSTGG